MGAWLIVGGALLVLFLAWGIPIQRRRRAALAALWARNCAGRHWRRTFPDASSDEIRDYLAHFEVAFDITHAQALTLAPADRVMALYRAHYPDPNMPDALELETILRRLEKRYGRQLPVPLHAEVTFGELFALARGSAA